MKKLSLKPNAFKKGEVLTRAQLKKVMGGTGSGIGNCQENYYLSCTTPGGKEDWCRSSISGDATAACNAIYPAYNGSGVSGEWGVIIRP
ncbi:hypothetical protein CA265_12580 [Sphingobacteriaceae bacterium GW460-11-11-14-LB5]|nr:hypothetical protein CA265_12580 [Sphingobacteriaceae bacterium GW460-11-11-14-LB5]